MCFYSIQLLTHILTRPPQMATSIQRLSLRNRGEKKKTLKTDFTNATWLSYQTKPNSSHLCLAIAEVYFQEGNNEYRKGELRNAIYFYTEGIKVSCEDDELNAKLYSNRAAAHFSLGEFMCVVHAKNCNYVGRSLRAFAK